MRRQIPDHPRRSRRRLKKLLKLYPRERDYYRQGWDVLVPGRGISFIGDQDLCEANLKPKDVWHVMEEHTK